MQETNFKDSETTIKSFLYFVCKNQMLTKEHKKTLSF